MADPDVVGAVSSMLEGGPGLLLPRDRSGRVRTFTAGAFDPAGTPRNPPALVLFTSGSTGAPKGVALSVDALVASARATEDLLSGPGRWHLCLPVNHIAGLQVVLRALLAGAPPTMPSPVRAPSFDPRVFADDLTGTLVSAGDDPVYTSLVPTQLSRILAVPQAAAALARTSAVLLGGASISPQLLERAADAGVPIVRTYGMSETAGGCVYDGLPFPDVDVRLSPDGRIVLAGPVLADGYVHVEDQPPASGANTAAEAPVAFTAIPHPADSVSGHLAGGFHGEGPERFLVTSDLGTWEEVRTADEPTGHRSTGHGSGPGPRARIAVLGRADDVIVTGGENVSPHEVETALLPVTEPRGFSDVLVTSREDPEWGEVLVALLVPAGGDRSDSERSADDRDASPGARAAPPDLLAAIRAGLKEQGMSGARIPRHALVVDELPLKSLGKPDRAAARVLARSSQRARG